MSNTIDVAKYLIYAYEQFSNSKFETQELKLQKLMYFVQRESFTLTGEALFPSDFEGQVHEPGLVELRYFFEQDYVPYNGDSSSLSETDKYIIESVINKYGQYDAQYLRNLSHGELSWKNSYDSIDDGEVGNKIISKDNIKKMLKKFVFMTINMTCFQMNLMNQKRRFILQDNSSLIGKIKAFKMIIIIIVPLEKPLQ